MTRSLKEGRGVGGREGGWEGGEEGEEGTYPKPMTAAEYSAVMRSLRLMKPRAT